MYNRLNKPKGIEKEECFMLKVIWVILWIATQRIMMATGIVAHDPFWGTIILTLIAFVVCHITYRSWLLVFYLAWVIWWGVNCIQSGALLAGIIVWVFHIGLFLIFIKSDTKKDQPGKKRRTRM